MLVIRSQQMDTFRGYMSNQFATLLMACITDLFPDASTGLDAQEMHVTIQWGIKRTRQYQFTSQNSIAKYIFLTFLFGKDFEKDPTLSWMHAILNDNDIDSPDLKMDKIFDLLIEG